MPMRRRVLPEVAVPKGADPEQAVPEESEPIITVMESDGSDDE